MAIRVRQIAIEGRVCKYATPKKLSHDSSKTPLMHVHLYVYCSFRSSSRLLVYRLGNTIGCRLACAYLSVINAELLSVRIMLPIDIKNLNR